MNPRAALAAFAFSAMLPAQAGTGNTDIHNTLVLVADDVGVDAIAAYGESTAPGPTPQLSALAQGGVLFRQCWGTPLCSPTRATFMTGRHGFRTGIGSVIDPGQPGLSYTETILPEVLTTASVGHALIGKWHLGERSGDLTPNASGWSHFAGAIGGGVPSYTSWPKVVDGVRANTTTYATTDEVNEALAWIQGHPEPWCVVVNFHAGHAPLHAPPASLHSQNLTGLDPATTPAPFFKAMLEAMDREIGRLLGGMTPSVRGRTNVVFLGDNGTLGNVTGAPFPTDHGKNTLYQGGVRVPLLVHGPAVTAPGREVTAPVHVCDLFATLGEIHGVDVRAVVPAATPLDCVSMVPYLRNPTQAPLRATVYSELFGGTGMPGQRNNGWAIRDDQHKLIRWTDRVTPVEALFDLAADPFEQRDLLPNLSATQRRAYEDLKTAAARLRGESLFLGFGAGCAGSAGVPTLTAPGGPRIGTTLTLSVGNLAAATPLVLGVLGLSRDQFGVVPLPLDLAAAGMPGCALLVGLDLLHSVPATAGTASWRLAIPSDPALVGGCVFAQALVPEAGANQGGVIASGGAVLVIG